MRKEEEKMLRSSKGEKEKEGRKEGRKKGKKEERGGCKGTRKYGFN